MEEIGHENPSLSTTQKYDSDNIKPYKLVSDFVIKDNLYQMCLFPTFANTELTYMAVPQLTKLLLAYLQ